MSVRHSQWLNGVMYALYHVRDLDEVRENNYAYNFYPSFVEKFNSDQKGQIIEAIEWALDQETVNSCCSLPKLPRSEEFKREYLKIVLVHFKKAASTNNA